MSIVIVISYCKRRGTKVQFKIDPSWLPISRHFKKTRECSGICFVLCICVCSLSVYYCHSKLMMIVCVFSGNGFDSCDRLIVVRLRGWWIWWIFILSARPTICFVLLEKSVDFLHISHEFFRVFTELVVNFTLHSCWQHWFVSISVGTLARLQKRERTLPLPSTQNPLAKVC